MSRKNKTDQAAVDPQAAVDAWRELTTATDQLHDINDTTLREDPAANPRTLEQRIAAADTVSRAVLAEQAEQADDQLAAARRRRRSRAQRGERALTQAEARASRAAATLEAIDSYEEADNPAASSLALHEADPRIRRMLIAVSLAGSAASALGIGAWASTSWDLPIAVLVGVLAEALLTVPVILLLTFQGLVRTHNKGAADALGEDARRVLGIMLGAIGVLLVVSVGLNVAGIIAGGTGLLGAVGIAGAVIALGASAASWGTTTVIRAVIRANTTQWRTGQWAAERERLEATAAGAFIPDVDDTAGGGAASGRAPEVDEAERVRRILAVLAEEQITTLAHTGTDALQALLNATPPTGGVAGVARGGEPSLPGGGQVVSGEGATAADLGVPQGATSNATPAELPVADPDQGDAEPEQGPVVEGRTWPRPPTPEQGRRQLVEYARWQLARGQAPGIRDAARRMQTSARSITRYKEALAEDAAYAELMEAFRQQP